MAKYRIFNRPKCYKLESNLPECQSRSCLSCYEYSIDGNDAREERIQNLVDALFEELRDTQYDYDKLCLEIRKLIDE